MTRFALHRRRLPGVAVLLLALAALGPAAGRAVAQSNRPARQVTVFGIVATANSMAIDPKLEAIAPQLRKLLPNHGFKLLDVQSKRLLAGQSLHCSLRDGLVATTTLNQALDENGKVQLHCELYRNTIGQFATDVATPPNQLFFCDKTLDDGTRLLIGIGAR